VNYPFKNKLFHYRQNTTQHLQISGRNKTQRKQQKCKTSYNLKVQGAKHKHIPCLIEAKGIPLKTDKNGCRDVSATAL